MLGSLFVREQSTSRSGEEEPGEVLNQEGSFIVLQREDPDELRFYNQSAIMRVEYTEDQPAPDMNIEPISCQLQMMDGSLIHGTIREPLPPDRLRLFDYLNWGNQRFIKLRVNHHKVCLVNKSYIIHIIDPDAVRCTSTPVTE